MDYNTALTGITIIMDLLHDVVLRRNRRIYYVDNDVISVPSVNVNAAQQLASARKEVLDLFCECLWMPSTEISETYLLVYIGDTRIRLLLADFLDGSEPTFENGMYYVYDAERDVNRLYEFYGGFWEEVCKRASDVGKLVSVMHYCCNSMFNDRLHGNRDKHERAAKVLRSLSAGGPGVHK